MKSNVMDHAWVSMDVHFQELLIISEPTVAADATIE